MGLGERPAKARSSPNAHPEATRYGKRSDSLKDEAVMQVTPGFGGG